MQTLVRFFIVFVMFSSCSTKNNANSNAQKPDDDCKTLSSLSGMDALNDIVKMSEIVTFGSCRLSRVENGAERPSQKWVILKNDTRLVDFEIEDKDLLNVSANSSNCSGVPYWNTTTNIRTVPTNGEAVLFWNIREDMLETREFAIRDAVSNEAIVSLDMCR